MVETYEFKNMILEVHNFGGEQVIKYITPQGSSIFLHRNGCTCILCDGEDE